jgi:hypothetical protein
MRRKPEQSILTFVPFIFQTNDETLSEEKIKLYISGIVQKMGETKTNTSDTLVPILLKFAQCREEQVRAKERYDCLCTPIYVPI